MHTIKNDSRIYILDLKEGNMVAAAIMSHRKALQELIDNTDDEARKRELREKQDEFRDLLVSLND